VSSSRPRRPEDAVRLTAAPLGSVILAANVSEVNARSRQPQLMAWSDGRMKGVRNAYIHEGARISISSKPGTAFMRSIMST
jgi:hypothetical protein